MTKDLKIKISIDKKTGNLKVVDGEFKSLNKSIKNTSNNATKLSSTIIKIGAGAVALVGVTKTLELLSNQAGKMVSVAANFEKFDATLKTIEGSSQKAQQSMKWIQDFALKTPFDIDKVTSSFISLRSYGLEPTDGLLRTLGDTSAAMGKDIQQGVEAMADAVVGENERLKEYGIKAYKNGDKIKYLWRNSSNEARQIIIKNNSDIIESTISSIFNSKYAGAAEEQSKTWNGLISNMRGNWTIFQKNLMDSGVFDYLKAIVTVVGDYMGKAFGNAIDSSATFSKYVIESIKGIISGFGSAYDSLETLGDYFSVVGDGAKVAFYGIQTISSTVARGMWQSFEGVLNSIIDGFNNIIALANSTGLVKFDLIGKVDFNVDALKQREDYVYTQLEKAKHDLSKSKDSLFTTGAGSNFTDNLISKIDEAYVKIQDTPEITSEKIDFGDAVTKSSDVASEALKDYDANINTVIDSENTLSDKMQETISNVSDGFSDLNTTLGNSSDDSDTYSVVNNVTDSFNDLNTTTNSTADAIDSASDALDTFIFKFEDTFLNSIKNNINSLESIYSTSSSSTNLGYEDALALANTARTNLISNPLNVSAGDSYTSAYNQLVSSSDNYLSDKSNFSSQADYNFAQATVGSQLEEFQDTAMQTVDVLDSMNSFLETINQAFSDGILSDEEKATIAGVATTVNAKNDVLLGSGSVVVAGINSIPTSLDSQTYYDNSGLATDANINNQTYYNNSGLATDLNMSAQEYFNNNDIIKTVGSQEYYNNSGLATDGNISQQDYYDNATIVSAIGNQTYYDNTGLATNTITNSVKDAVKKLMGTGSSGISLTSISNSLPDLSVSTGLDVSELSSIKTNTGNTVSKTANVYAALGNASSGGVGLDNLKIKNITTSNRYPTKVNTFNGSNYVDYEIVTGTSTSYSYYAQGGFTGIGIGKRDHTGQKQAGIVHEDEWVAPSWMIKENPSLFGALEMARLGQKNAILSPNTSSNSNKNDNGYLFVLATEMKQMNSLLRQVTEGGNAMNVKAIS